MNEVKVGAPEVISGSQNSNANLSVQLMSRCKELTLEEDATAEGSIVTAARLLGQLRQEIETTESEGLGDSIQIQYSDSYKDDMLNGTSTQLFLKTGDLTVPSSSVFWVINNVKYIAEGCEVSVSHDGVVSVTNGGYVKCTIKAIDKNDSSKFVVKTVIINLTQKSSEIIAEHPELAEIIDEYRELVEIIAEHPELADIIAEWPPVINSLVQTGKRNWIYFNGSTYLKTGIFPSADREIIAIEKAEGVSGVFITIFGGQSEEYSSDSMVAQWHGHKWHVNIAGNSKIDGVHELNTIYNLKMNKTGFYVDDVLTITSDRTLTSGNRDIYLGACNTEGKLSGEIFKGYIGEFIAKEGDVIIYHLLPFVRNGEEGFLNLVDNTFIKATIGQFTIVTENV